MRRFVLCALLVLGGCKDCTHNAVDPTPDARAPMQEVRVVIERPGRPAFQVDVRTLLPKKPDTTSGPWTGWQLKNLVPDWDSKAPCDIIDDEGYRTPLLRVGESPGATEAYLIVSSVNEETRVVRVAPNEPLTAHQGEARKDAGRIRHAAKIVFLDPRDAGVVAGPTLSLKVKIAGKEATWTRDDLGKVKPIVLMSKDGDGERDAWDLRELAKTLVSPTAVVTEAVGEDDEVAKIDPKHWNDATLIPVIRSNRRGRLKLVWLDAKTKDESKDAPQLRGVTEVHFE